MFLGFGYYVFIDISAGVKCMEQSVDEGRAILREVILGFLVDTLITYPPSQ
jgi:hypothetical protein